MIVVISGTPNVPNFRLIKEGECFEFGGNAHIRIPLLRDEYGNLFNIVRLSTGTVGFLVGPEPVNKLIKCKFTCERF